LTICRRRLLPRVQHLSGPAACFPSTLSPRTRTKSTGLISSTRCSSSIRSSSAVLSCMCRRWCLLFQYKLPLRGLLRNKSFFMFSDAVYFSQASVLLAIFFPMPREAPLSTIAATIAATRRREHLHFTVLLRSRRLPRV
jgi:hypothetical protein